MDYSLYKAEDFAADQSFINYYLKQEEADELFWASWISHHPEMMDEILTAERMLGLVTVSISTQEYEHELNRLKTAISKPSLQQNLEIPDLSRYWKWAAAASLMLVCSIGLWLTIKSTTGTHSDLELSTLPGEQKILSLSDGSRITLNGGSKLNYPASFTGETREVKLTGEAYFEVAKDKYHPFTVHSGQLNTTVLGTKFNINFSDANDLRVSLVEGKVKITKEGLNGSMILVPGKQASFINNQLVMGSFDREEVMAWKGYGMKLDDASFEELAGKMRKTFGVVLINHSKRKNWQYTGQFNHTDYLTIVKTITYAKHLTYSIHRDTVTIH